MMDDEEVKEIFRELDHIASVLKEEFVEDWNSDDFRGLVDRLKTLEKYYLVLKRINPEDQG